SPVLTTSSAFQAKQLLSVTSSVTYLPAHWKKIYPELNPVDNDLITKPLYAVWLQNSDQQGLIGQLIAIPV
ncbi:transcriptional regulator HdfR, partial [Salmonella enterica subsp. enterica serovar Enteritidis]|nr:transcriptional regulator HdfR [Salmonella enterica subsp. enterica serovar Enteritidis]